MKKNLLLLVFGLFAGILFLFSISVYAQNQNYPKEFTQRTSQYSPSTKLYYLKGNFAMIGNKNLTLRSGNIDGDNADQMDYVDVDNVSRTINSSRAVLTFPMDYDANPECSEVVYAGLYWAGRADKSANGPETWVLNGREINPGQQGQTTVDCYTVRVSVTGVDDNNVTTYTFAPNNNQGVATVITFTGTASNYSITATVNGVEVPIPPVTVTETITPYNDHGTTKQRIDQLATFDPPYVISSGSCEIPVVALQKRTRNTPNNNACRLYLQKEGTTVLSKHKVLFKYGGDADHPDGTEGTYPYQTVIASSNDIYYPVSSNYYIYAAYAEVTDYVKEHGLGNYFVGNIALREGSDRGSGGGTGLSGEDGSLYGLSS